VVIGRGNTPAASVFLDRAAADGVPVVQRPSGGEAVVLSPRTLAVSAVHRAAEQLASRRYFEQYNGAVIRALETLGVAGLIRRGVSDVALGERKILGSSIYRNRQRVLYHAVLNVAESPELMERYLRPPARQPDYRRGRSHRDFVTSLAAAGHDLPTAALRDALHAALARVDLSTAPLGS
jgi:lipoate-protein ligase A